MVGMYCSVVLYSKLSVNNMAQKTRAAEVIPHVSVLCPLECNYARCTGNKTQIPRTQQKDLQTHSISRLLQAPHCCLVGHTTPNILRSWHWIINRISWLKIQIFLFLNLLWAIIMCYDSFVLLANRKHFGSLCCDLPWWMGPLFLACRNLGL